MGGCMGHGRKNQGREMTDRTHPDSGRIITSGAAIQPVLWVSPEQFANFVDADEAQFGRYVPARKTSAGNFTMPLFAARAPAPAQPAAELESQLAQRFDSADMATATAQGFRDGVAKDQQAMWRHIETAPKDGSYLLLWEQYSDAPFVGYWSGGSWSVSHEHVDAEGGWDGANVVDALSMPITHWMPLPPAPGPADGESK